MKKILFLSLFFCPLLRGQTLTFQHGIAFSLYFGNEFKYVLSYNPNVYYPIKTWDHQAFMPMVDFKLSLYNNNLGSSVLSSFRNNVHINLAFSPTLLYSFEEAPEENPGFVPIFSNTFVGQCFSPYHYNIGFSTVYIRQLGFGKVRDYDKRQRLGNLIFSLKNVYINYYNDGGPVNSWFGDSEDRFWTGGLAVGYKFLSGGSVHHISLSYDKYTGFVKHAFEAAGLLHNNQVLYKDPVEISYNSGKYSLRYRRPDAYFGGAINWWNTPFDFQDFLHRDISSDPYHMKLHKKYIDFEIFGTYGN